MRVLSACALVAALSLPVLAAPPKSKPGAEAQVEKPAGSAAPKLDVPRVAALKARSIGPAVMGGRVSALAVDPGDPDTFYVGLGTGGVFKSVNAGATFEAIFEKEAVAAVGALSLAPSDPKIVWLGTGEANDRNSSSWGNGVYRSTDGGATWANVGLSKSRAIARIAVHPKDASIAWVAAVGDLWVPNAERGLFKTTDAGKTWKKVLSAPPPYDARVGCGDLVIDPVNPDVVYAALYARQRSPWAFTYGLAVTDGKDLGGIFKSTDGGATWRKLEKGLPKETGRIGLDVYRKDPRVVYAVVQSDEGGTSGIDDILSRRGGVFRSEDGGETWTRMNALNPRPFYFSQIRVDPVNDQRVYVLGYLVHVSDDGGKSFREDLFEKVHADCHDLVVFGTPLPAGPIGAGPKSAVPEVKEVKNGAVAKVKEVAEPPRPPVSRRLLLGTDGGVYQSYEAGKTWAHLNKFAAGEYYRIALDDSVPYRICGGLQDNTNWVGPSRVPSKEGITNADFTNIGGGDGFYCIFDPFDKDVFFAESQEGELHRFNARTGEIKVLRPVPTEGQPGFRFHWASPLVPSRHEKGAFYLAGNRVFLLRERGEVWKLISPDLSTQDPRKTTATGSGAETFGVVYTLAESPVSAGLLWAGTDDGKLWVTEDGGGRWTDRTAQLPASVKGQWISRVEASSHDPKVAYLAVDAHRTGNLAPLAYRTADGGKTWQSIAGDLPANGPVKVVREDLTNADLLYAGTELGLYASLDRGGSWVRLGELPTVAVDDIAIHPRDGDLVIATHGRSLYVADDVRALQEMTPEVAAKAAHLFPPRPAFGSYLLSGWEDSSGTAVYRGENPPEGALITFWVKELSGDPVKIAITNAEGQPVANLKAPASPGLGRVSWDLRPTKDVLTEYGGMGAKKLVRPGEYTVTLTLGKLKERQKLNVIIAEGIETR